MSMAQKPFPDPPMGFRLARNIAWVSGFTALVTSLLIIANFVQMRRIDPLESPALTTMIAKLADTPKDEQLKQEIRALDLLSRKAFFSSRAFKKTGAILLLGSVATLIAALRMMMSYRESVPVPGAPWSKTRASQSASWSRWAIGFAFGGLVITSLGLNMTQEPRFPHPVAQTSTPKTAAVASAAAAETPESETAAAKPPPSAAMPAEETAASEPSPAVQNGPAEPAPTASPAPPAPVELAGPEELQQNWPAFRGYRSLGFSAAKDAPRSWDGESGTNVLWKTEVPRPGYSSPIIWDDKIWLTGGDDDVREVYCFAADSGNLLWRHEVTGIEGSPEQAPRVTPDTGHAASTPATNGSAVFAIFSTGNVLALDFDGSRKWARNLGVPKNHYGHSSSLITWDDLVLVQYDHGTSGSLIALDQATGTTRWETKRDTGISWSSPIIANTGSRDEIILTANPLVAAYDPISGASLWQVSCLSGEVGPSAAYADGLVFAVNEYAILAAISLPSLEIVWETDYDLSEVSSPLAVNGRLFLGTSDGAITCFDAKTGTRIWQEFFDYGFYASPVLAQDHIYLIDNSGTMHIFKASSQYEAVSHSPLGEESYATPAIVDGRVICRGVKHLFCLGSS